MTTGEGGRPSRTDWTVEKKFGEWAALVRCGFVSVFALFLGGMRMRKLAEDTTRASLAASCLIDEIRIDAGDPLPQDTGAFGGLGLQVDMVEGLVRVVAPMPGTPAAISRKTW